MDKYLDERVNLSLVCPVASCGPEAVEEIYRRLRRRGELCDCSYEIVLVTDGSDEATLRAVREIASDDHAVGCVNLSRAFGPESAAAAGCAYAMGQAAAIVLPGEPEDLPARALAVWREGAEIVGHSSGQALPLLLDRKAIRAIGAAYGRMRLDADAMAGAGFKRAKVSFSRKLPRKTDRPRMTALDWLFGLFGACLLGGGAAMWLYADRLLDGEAAMGLYANRLLAVAAALAGLLLICTGAIRARLAAAAWHGPVYIVRDTFGFSDESQSGRAAGGDDQRKFKVMT